MIEAEVVADSVYNTNRIITVQVKFPRFILAEMNTHRVFSRSYSSSRAVPINSISKQMEEDAVYPIAYGKNQPGMRSTELLSADAAAKCRSIWRELIHLTKERVKELSETGLHKQWAGRPLETYQSVIGVITSTEWKNFFHLRDDVSAQPEMQALAQAIKKAISLSDATILKAGEWHLPFIRCVREHGTMKYYTDADSNISLEDAQMVSASACAQTSYRKRDLSLDKAKEIYSKLVISKPVHASPFEHIATPIIIPKGSTWLNVNGITHQSKDGSLWSGNFREWIQFRQLIPDNVKV